MANKVSKLKFNNVTYDLADESSRAAINNLEGQLEATRVDLNNMRAAVGSPLTAATTSAMIDKTKIYVYTGTTTTVSGVTFTAGNWYYHDGTKWQLGGTYNETALETDTTLTVSGAAADAKVTGDKVTELKNALGTYGIVEFGGDIESNAWVSDSHRLTVLIPVKPGSRIKVKATSVENDSVIGAIKNVTLPIIDGSAVTFSSDPSWASAIHINRNQVFSGVAPDDIEYLYYYCGYSTTFTRMPVSVEVDGYDYLQGAIENLIETNKNLYENNDYLDETNYRLDAIQTYKNLLKRAGSIDGGLWVQSNYYSHILYPVNPGDIVEVFGKSGNTAYIAGIKTGDIEWGQPPDYSEEIGWTSAIAITDSQHWYGVVPNDVHYLYMYYGSDNSVRLPLEVYVNNYNIIESIANNATESRDKILSDYEYYGDTSSGKWTRIGDSHVSYLLIPVKSGDKVDILTYAAGSISQTYANFLKSYSNPVTGENLDLSEVEGFTAVITIPQKTHKTFTVPEDVNYLYVFEGTNPNKPKRPVVLMVNGYDYVSGKQLLTDELANIRIAQFNIGKFAFGYSNNPSASTFGLLSMIAYDEPGQLRRHQDYTYGEYVEHYRKMLLHYHPDIVGMEEYINPINVMVGTDQNVTISKNMGDEVFDFTYPSKTYYSSRQQCIRSKFTPIISYLKPYSYEYNGETISADFMVSYYLYCGKLVCVGCNALVSTSNDEDMAKRAVQLPAILDLFTDEEFVFLTFDVNNGGNYRTTPEGSAGYVSSPEEGAQLLAIAERKGWTFAHGKYLPFEKTWFAPTGSGYNDGLFAIDNIIYKNNGKTILRDFEVMPLDDAHKLPADHCPIFGDFMLM